MSQIRNIYPALKKKPIRYEVEKSSNNDDTTQHISDSFLISFRFNREVLFMLLQLYLKFWWGLVEMETGLVMEDAEHPDRHHSAEHQADDDVRYQGLAITLLRSRWLFDCAIS